jgi:hypothetical protein
MTSLIPDSYKYFKLIGIPRNRIGHKVFSGFEIPIFKRFRSFLPEVLKLQNEKSTSGRL